MELVAFKNGHHFAGEVPDFPNIEASPQQIGKDFEQRVMHQLVMFRLLFRAATKAGYTARQ